MMGGYADDSSDYDDYDNGGIIDSYDGYDTGDGDGDDCDYSSEAGEEYDGCDDEYADACDYSSEAGETDDDGDAGGWKKEDVSETEDAGEMENVWAVERDPTLAPGQMEIVQEMEQNGEMDIMPGEMGKVQTGGANGRTAQIDIEMPYNPDAVYEVESFTEQAQFQEDGLNNLTVSAYLENYEKRRESGRSPEGTKAQAQYRDGLAAVIIDDKLQEGLSLEEAEREADEELGEKSALHNPDQIAGGDPDVLSAAGDSDVNSALGSLWGHGRAEALYNRVSGMAAHMTQEERDSTYIDVCFNVHSK